MKIGRIGILVLLAFAGFIPVACDTSNGSTTETADVETNFGVGLASVIAAEGVPDSLVAEISIGGVVVDTMRPDLSTRTEAGVLRFPIGAPDGSHVSVYYRIYKGGGVVAVGQVSWVVGEQPLVPRPNLAPRVRIGGDADVIVRRNSPYMFHMTSSDTENALRALLVDRDGDGVMDDSIVPPTGRDSILLRWSDAGTYRLCVWARDDHDLRRRDTTIVRVVPAAKIAISQDTTVSVGDSVDVFVSMSYDDPAQSSSMQLAWNASGDTSTTSMKASRRFVWPKSGTYSIVVAATDVAGEASRDTMVVHVLQDAPKLDLSDFPRLVDLGGVATLPIGVEQSFGTIARWGMDFDADTSKGWDTAGTGLVPSVQHLFGRSRSSGEKVFVFVVDDDGNRRVSSGSISVSTSNSGAVLRRVSPLDTVLSVDDTATLRFQRAFPEGLESRSRMEWNVDGNRLDTTSVVLSRSFAWGDADTHTVSWRLVTPIGSTSWETVNALVVSDAPKLDLPFPAKVDRNTCVTLSPKATDRYGTIARWGMDFDADTADGWDTVLQGEPGAVMHVFSQLDTARKILVFAVDDDGNRAIGSHTLQVVSGAELLTRLSGAAQRVSIGDTVSVTFQENFSVAGTRSVSRLVWNVDALAPETLQVAAERRFAWSAPGTHTIRTRLIGPFGSSSADSSTVDVVRDAPVLNLDDLPDTVSASIMTSLRLSSKDEFGRVVSWSIDYGGTLEGGWDSTGTGSLPAVVEHSFPDADDPTIRVRVRDDDGNETIDSAVLHVRKGVYGLVQRTSSGDTSLSIGDEVWVRLSVSTSLAAYYSSLRLVWRVDDASPETLSVVDARRFLWNVPGTHVIRFRAVGSFGGTGWDSSVVRVVQGVPAIVSIARIGAGVGKTITFSTASDPVFGRIVKERWDFGDDGIWDDSSTVAGGSYERVFATSAPVSIRVQVRDDDGNVDDSVFSFAAKNAKPSFGSVSFVDAAVGVSRTARLRASFSDSDGVSDLSSLSVDWTADGVWDTVRDVSGLASDELAHVWSTAGTKKVRLRLEDRSGATDYDSAIIDVTADPPVIKSLKSIDGGLLVRVHDTIGFVASIVDASDPADLDSLRWFVDGVQRKTLSLRGRSIADAEFGVASNEVGTHRIKAVVSDLVGNRDSLDTSWTVVSAPPFIMARLSDTILVSNDSAYLTIDSLRTGSRGGAIASAAWRTKENDAWNPIYLPAPGASLQIRLPGVRDSLWHVEVRAVQDNGEIAYDTLHVDLLKSFVDARNGVRYPIVTIGGVEWMGRNLRWKMYGTSDIRSVCPEGRDCDKAGYDYDNPSKLVDNQFSDGKAVVSVCPDGWRMPSVDDWNTVIAASSDAVPGVPEAREGILLRSRLGWTSPMEGQNDPLRFDAVPSVPGGATTAIWWAFKPGVASDQKWVAMLSNEFDVHYDVSGTDMYPVRCVRNTGVIIDTGWRREGQVLESSWMPGVSVRAYLPDNSASVYVQLSTAGASRDTVLTPERLGESTGGASIHLPIPSLPGRYHYTLQLEQVGSAATDTMNCAWHGKTLDDRYRTTRVGNQIWMAENVNVDTVPYLAGTDSIAGFHYTIDAAFGGVAPAAGPTGSVQGICPEGMHVPSLVEWNELFDSVRAEGLDPQAVLRGESFYWASGLGQPKDIYGFGALPEGRYNGGDSWNRGAFFWAADGNGYTMVTLDNGAGSFMLNGPHSRSIIADRAVSLRCVGSP